MNPSNGSVETLLLPSISTIIVNYNAGRFLTNCVRTALNQSQEVIVVDNGSKDDSLAFLNEQLGNRPELKVIATGKNLGFAAGCQIGVKESTKDYVLFLNPDCELIPGSLNRMLQVLKENPKAGMVGGFLTDPDGKEQAGGRRAVPTPWRSFVRAFGLYRFADRWPKLFFDFNLHKQPLPTHPIEVEAVSGALMLVRRQAINEVGNWDANYFLHCEDLDWCMRFWQKGWKILFVPDAPVVHHKGVCSRSRPIFVEWHKHKGMSRFYNKFFRHQYPGIVMWIVTGGVWLRFSLVATVYGFKNLLQFFKRKSNVPS